MFSSNLQLIRQKLAPYPRATLVCVTKTQSSSRILEAIHAGETCFGENYAQEFLEHKESIVSAANIHWHFIGHLQKNKVRLIIDTIDLIHSVDSLELAQEIDKRAASISKIQPILIEVNLGGEETKSGIAKERVDNLVEKISALPNILLQGLMTLPPYSINPEDVRPYFRELREIRDAINFKKLYKQPLTELSMGMSQDFEVALEEGATFIRIGTLIFGERQKVKK